MSLIYPRRCEACGNVLRARESFVCLHCVTTLPRSNYHLDPAANEVSQLLGGRVPAKMASAFLLFEKGGRVQNMLHAIKYNEQKELGRHLGTLCGRELESSVRKTDVLVPIPLHPSKEKKRGFNQSYWFAKGINESSGTPVENKALQRVSNTSTQTRKNKYQRWENVDGIFKVMDPAPLIGKHVLLVDDVITTGATIEAAWLALREVPGISISVLSIAFASRRV